MVDWLEENHCADLLLVAGCDDGGYDDEGCDDGVVMMGAVMIYFLD
jgi:hypothetical protein